MIRRRRFLTMGAGATAAAIAAIRPFADPFGPTGKQTVATADAVGEPYHGFVLLPFGAALPTSVVAPEGHRIPSSEAGGVAGSDQFLSPEDAADTYHIPVPILDIQLLPPDGALLNHTPTQVRVNALNQPFWASTAYFLADEALNFRPVVSLRVQLVWPKPAPIWPSGSPSSGIIPPEKVSYLPQPGLRVFVGPAESGLWIHQGALFAVDIDRELAPSLTLAQLAPHIMDAAH